MEFAGGRAHQHLDAGERPAVPERPLPMLAAMPNQLQQQLAVHVLKAEALHIDKPGASDLVDPRHQEVGVAVGLRQAESLRRNGWPDALQWSAASCGDRAWPARRARPQCTLQAQFIPSA